MRISEKKELLYVFFITIITEESSHTIHDWMSDVGIQVQRP